MAQRSKHESLRVMWQRYQSADRLTRSALLDEVTRVCGYHRKYAIGLLSRPPAPRPAVRRVSRRRPTYGEPVIRLLAEVWAASGYLCGLRLKAALPHWLPWLQRRTAVPPALAAQLQRISPRPGARLKHQIPIKTDCQGSSKSPQFGSSKIPHPG